MGIVSLILGAMFVIGMHAVAAEPKVETDKRTSGSALRQSTSTAVVGTERDQTPPLSSQAGTSESAVGEAESVKAELKAAVASPQAGEQIKWQIISSGGNRSMSTNFVMSATVGQTAVGLITSTNYEANQGFWQSFGTSGGGCCVTLSIDGRTGNVDGDPALGVDISDLSALIDFLYISFTPPPCMQSANIDGDGGGGVDISDLSGLIDFLYISFTPPSVCQ